MTGPSTKRERWTRWLLAGGIVLVLAMANAPTVTSLATSAYHDYEVNQQVYKEAKGHWSILPVPSQFHINAIHASLLYTGKVLIIAGSGNNEAAFKAGKFKSIIWDPATNNFKEIHTPSDMFCAGHIELPDGKLLIAGGTKRYEVLASEVKRAAGVMTVENQSPNGDPVHLKEGTVLRSPDGVEYRTTEDETIDPAKMTIGANGKAEAIGTKVEVWVEATLKGKSSVIEKETHFAIDGVTGQRAKDLYGIAAALTMEKQDFFGDDKSYLFDPATETFKRIGNLQIARWYPTLVGLKDGRVLAISGLDEYGRIVNGQTEVYSPSSQTWKIDQSLTRTFPTYPAMFLMPDGNLFYSGSNAGYGSATIGRAPGVWNLEDNTFKDIPGLTDANMLETSASLLLPPAQAQRYMILGGGGVGQSEKSTSRTAIVDLNQPDPKFEEGPRLDQPTRYPIAVIAPDNTVIVTGGSRYYRGNHGSDLFECHVFNPQTNRLTTLASPTVGRNYHSEGLLLPDGRIVTLGGNPLYGNAQGTAASTFEQRIEVYSPPYLYHGARPKVTGGPFELTRGDNAAFETPDATAIRTANLLRPGSYTHVTDVEQRSIALNFAVDPSKKKIVVSIPSTAGLVPTGWYMLFVTNREATPSVARWVHVS